MSMSPHGYYDAYYLQAQKLRRCIRAMLQHQALQLWRARMVWVRIHRHVLAGAPLPQLEWPRSGAVAALQPGVAHVVADRLGHHGLLVHDAADQRRKAVQQEIRRVLLSQGQHQGPVIGRLDPLGDVVLGEAELIDDERRRLVEDDGPLQRKRRVLRRHRIAGGELAALHDLERGGEPILTGGPALRQVALDLGWIGKVRQDQPVIGVAEHLAAAELERFLRVEAHHVVELHAHHDQVAGSLRQRGDRSGPDQRAGAHGAKQGAAVQRHTGSPSGSGKDSRPPRPPQSAPWTGRGYSSSSRKN